MLIRLAFDQAAFELFYLVSDLIHYVPQNVTQVLAAIR